MAIITTEILSKYIEVKIARIFRLKYEVNGRIVSGNDGSVEIVFDDGALLRVDSGPSGDTVRLRDDPWSDPFSGQLSRENEEFVRKAGKWTRFDMSDDEQFADLIGRDISDIAPVSGSGSERKLYGVVLNVSGDLVALYCAADQLRVQRLS
jgi:hypothetical protein